ncbi:MAG: sarcosine oxidase subunit beta family protein [Gammaproteobacteria bacterium]|nr:sarcosine oxidase subunit beta family protein [Gammaproteobacteria bacterium]MDH5304276.1 sarcosine oxidase subunit beta family protein [Gammaproteobacteria bacterium]MDH5321542.1 sarcosine oxidase subunit beta family protein [Gammaproteobacteria bacterium]
MKGYSAFSLIRNALQGHRHWQPLWRNPEPKRSYDVVIIGAGGHGLATAYYLASKHGIRNVAVLEKGYLGGGNSGRNTQVTRSNYFWPQSAAFFDHSLKLYEGLGLDLNFNIMFSQRGVLTVAHSQHEIEMMRRWTNALQINRVDSELLTPAEIRQIEPLINLHSRFPVVGGYIQRRAGISRHDAVVWGFARAASALGVDIIQQCEVTGLDITDGAVTGVQTNRGDIDAGKVCIAVAGNTSMLAAMAGFRVPIVSMALQAMVSEPVKPCLNTMLGSTTIHMYVSQSDRGEIVLGGGADAYPSYAQRGGIPIVEENVAAVLELLPAFSSLRLMRQWAGINDITPDTTPIMGSTPVRNLYISGGWGTGGYKAIPAGGDTMAYTIANDEPHALIRDFGLDRFERGALIDEGAASGVAH